jgi:hypothetical protein
VSFIKVPKLVVFQIDELLHFIDFRRKFIKMQNQFCLKTLGRNLQVLCYDLELRSLMCSLGQMLGNECFVCTLYCMHVL